MGSIRAPPLPSHHLSTGELELRFGGFERTHMGLKPLERLSLQVNGFKGPWRLREVFLTRSPAAACTSGLAAPLLDTSAGRAADGSILIAGPVRIDAGFPADEAEEVCSGPCRVDLSFDDRALQPRCVTMELTR